MKKCFSLSLPRNQGGEDLEEEKKSHGRKVVFWDHIKKKYNILYYLLVKLSIKFIIKKNERLLNFFILSNNLTLQLM